MRWLVWASFFPPHVGGYERNVFELARRLAGAGECVIVVTCATGDTPRFEVMQGIVVHRLPCWRLLGGLYPVPKPSLTLLDLFRAKADVESTQTRFFPLSLVGAIHAWLHRTPLIHTERGTRHTALDNRLLDAVSKTYDHTVGCWIVRRAAKTVGVSQAACAFAEHLGADEPVRIPNGVPCVGGAPRVRPEGHTILFVGRLIWAKGVQDLLAALGRLDRPWRLEVVGDGPHRNRLQELVARGGHRDRVEFLGVLTGEQLWERYRKAAVFVNPSYSEGLPTSVLEAAALGVPVVATDVGGTGEIIEHERTGLLVRPGDVVGLSSAVKWALDNREQAEAMATEGQGRVRRNFSWDRIVDSYLVLARRVCGHGPT